jgi:succinyl-diaminopimelate desuccinylase
VLEQFERVAKRIESYSDYVVDLEKRLTAVPALDPSSGGEGEGAKAKVIVEMLGKIGVSEVEVLESEDPRVPSGRRPNIVARIPGRDRSRALWLMAHMDVVPAGELKNWTSDPFVARVDGRKIFGRGVEDNQQGIVSALCLARALLEEKTAPPIDLGLLFVADEETGNKLGIEYLLEHHETFRKGDLIVVPDGGLPDGSMIEVAEKGILWLKITVRGKQTHGSTPDKGVNAHTAAAHLVVRLEELHSRFAERDPVFDPPTSTFEATKVEAGVPNVNSIPGEHTFYMDTRVMPRTRLDDVLEAVRSIAAEVDAARGTRTEIETVQRQDAAPPTSVEAPVVRSLERAVKAVYGVTAKPMGIGGGTVAAFIRRHGYAAAVWARMDETMHGPDEYCIIDNLLGDAKVFAHILLA